MIASPKPSEKRLPAVFPKFRGLHRLHKPLLHLSSILPRTMAYRVFMMIRFLITVWRSWLHYDKKMLIHIITVCIQGDLTDQTIRAELRERLLQAMKTGQFRPETTPRWTDNMLQIETADRPTAINIANWANGRNKDTNDFLYQISIRRRENFGRIRVWIESDPGETLDTISQEFMSNNDIKGMRKNEGSITAQHTMPSSNSRGQKRGSKPEPSRLVLGERSKGFRPYFFELQVDGEAMANIWKKQPGG